MYNYVMLVGTVKSVHGEFVVNQKKVYVTLELNKPFRDSDGNFEKEYFCVLFNDYLGDLVLDNIHEGMKVSIKGRLRQSNHETLCYVIGDRVMVTGGGESYEINSRGKENC